MAANPIIPLFLHGKQLLPTWCVFVRASLHMCSEEKPTRCHCMLYCTSDTLNMFRALLCPSSGALFQLAIHPPYTTWQGQSCRIPLPGRTPCCPAPDPDSQQPRYVQFHIHLNNILNTCTTTSNSLTLTLLTFHTIDTLYPLLSLGTHTT
jgi:hypothetical protein